MSDSPITKQVVTCLSCGNEREPRSMVTGNPRIPAKMTENGLAPCDEPFHFAHEDGDRVWTIDLCECNEHPCCQETPDHAKGRPVEVVPLARLRAAERVAEWCDDQIRKLGEEAIYTPEQRGEVLGQIEAFTSCAEKIRSALGGTE